MREVKKLRLVIELMLLKTRPIVLVFFKNMRFIRDLSPNLYKTSNRPNACQQQNDPNISLGNVQMALKVIKCNESYRFHVHIMECSKKLLKPIRNSLNDVFKSKNILYQRSNYNIILFSYHVNRNQIKYNFI